MRTHLFFFLLFSDVRNFLKNRDACCGKDHLFYFYRKWYTHQPCKKSRRWEFFPMNCPSVHRGIRSSLLNLIHWSCHCLHWKICDWARECLALFSESHFAWGCENSWLYRHGPRYVHRPLRTLKSLKETMFNFGGFRGPQCQLEARSRARFKELSDEERAQKYEQVGAHIVLDKVTLARVEPLMYHHRPSLGIIPIE